MDSRPRLFFAHANGYTPGAYEAFLDPLRRGYRVEAPALLPLRTGRAPSGDWREIADDLGALIDAGAGPVVGVGHSLGAVSLLMAAAQRPARFSRLVLIEPPVVPTWAAALLNVAPAAVRRRGRLAAAARRRRDSWASLEEAYESERRRHWYGLVPDAALRLVLSDGLHHDGSSWRLRFPPEWEARLYEQPASVWPLLRRALPPLCVLRGAQSRVFRSQDYARWRQMRPQDTAIEIPDAGHLLPLERPAAALGW